MFPFPELIKVFVHKIGESESKSIISTYLLDRQFKLMEKPSRAKMKQKHVELQGGDEEDNDSAEEERDLERYDDEDDDDISELKPELIVPLDRKTGELLLEIEDLPESFKAMKLKDKLLEGLDEY